MKKLNDEKAKNYYYDSDDQDVEMEKFYSEQLKREEEKNKFTIKL